MVEYQGLDDRQLIERTAWGDKGALEELYDRHSTAIFSLARYMLRHEAVAEEATQEVFINIWLRASSYRPERGEPRAWLMSVAHHKVIDIIRAQKRTAAASDPEDYETLAAMPSKDRGTEEEAHLNMERARVRQALAKLPEAQREVIALAYFRGLSQSEIAARLNQPLGTVKTRVRLAMQKLRAELEEDVTEPI